MRENVDDGWQKRCGVARGRWRWRQEVSCSSSSSLHFFPHLSFSAQLSCKEELKFDKLLPACLLPFGCWIRWICNCLVYLLEYKHDYLTWCASLSTGNIGYWCWVGDILVHLLHTYVDTGQRCSRWMFHRCSWKLLSEIRFDCLREE